MSLAAEENNRIQRRTQLLAVAARLFAEHGFAGTTVDQIAREFGVRKASLYHWVGSKEALLVEILLDAASDQADALEEILGRELSAADRLRLMFREQIDSWVRDPYRLSLAYDVPVSVRNEPSQPYTAHWVRIVTAFKTLISQGIESGEFSLDASRVSIVTETILGALNTFPRWYNAEGWANPRHVADMMADAFLVGLRSRGST